MAMGCVYGCSFYLILRSRIPLPCAEDASLYVGVLGQHGTEGILDGPVHSCVVQLIAGNRRFDEIVNLREVKHIFN